jgi:hypothetical protein
MLELTPHAELAELIIGAESATIPVRLEGGPLSGCAITLPIPNEADDGEDTYTVPVVVSIAGHRYGRVIRDDRQVGWSDGAWSYRYEGDTE